MNSCENFLYLFFNVVKDQCQLPADIGNCQNYTALWYYDTKIKRCRQFYYGGCGGNDNRFNSENECEQRCKRSEEEEQPRLEVTTRPQPTQSPVTKQKHHCLLPYESGRCQERIRRFYFDRSYGICTQFLYTGCDGNENNFETLEDCEELCKDSVDLCDLSPLEGRCDENVTKWYFDAYSQRCHQFQFSGCDGNRNNFDDERSCMYTCQHKRTDQTPEPVPATTTRLEIVNLILFFCSLFLNRVC